MVQSAEEGNPAGAGRFGAKKNPGARAPGLEIGNDED